VSLSGIVREMSMSPAAVYRYFANRDALLAELVVDAYNELADSLAAIERGKGSAESHLDAVLRGTRAWALEHPNAYRLIFQTSIGSGQDFAAETTVAASARSMTVIITALAAVTVDNDPGAPTPQPAPSAPVLEAFRSWAERSGATDFSVDLLILAFLTWTRLHGIISLELGGHLEATGIGADAIFEMELATIRSRVALLAPAVRTGAGSDS
jgi:AcrR family transcriptional regulator